MAIVAARESSRSRVPTFTAVYCGSAELSRTAGAICIVIDLTEGMNADSLPKQRLMRPCIAILPEHTSAEELARRPVYLEM